MVSEPQAAKGHEKLFAIIGIGAIVGFLLITEQTELAIMVGMGAAFLGLMFKRAKTQIS